MWTAERMAHQTLLTVELNLKEFISDNERHQEVNRRWLAAWLRTNVLPVFAEVRTGKLDFVRDLVDEFRLGELDDAAAQQCRALDRLQDEARGLRNGLAARKAAKAGEAD